MDTLLQMQHWTSWRLFFVIVGVVIQPCISKQIEVLGALTNKEETELRMHVYNQKAVVYFESDERGRYPKLEVPEEVIALHKKKRLASLKFLVNIVRYARAEDAILADAYVAALEDNPVAGAMSSYQASDSFDTPNPKTNRSRRYWTLDTLNRRISQVEKKLKGNDK